MNKFDRECVICKTHYSYCPNCHHYDNLPRWMFLFCSQNCHDIYQELADYGNGEKTLSKTRAALKKLDLSRLDEFTPHYHDAVVNVLKTRKKKDSEELN